MTKSILTIPAWKLFVAFVIGMIAAQVTALVIATYFNWSREYGLYPTLRYGLMTLIYWTYPYLVGRALSQRSFTGTSTAPHRRILLIVLLAILNNTLSVSFIESNGVAWSVILVTMFVNYYCLINVLSFPARELKSIELKRTASFTEYWREMLYFTIWPISIWWMQPTLTFIVIEEEVSKKKRG